jgi:hypothetical protein
VATSFKYNADGLRVEKNSAGTITKYVLHGAQIRHLTQGSHELHFFYDAEGKPSIVRYNGTSYAYLYNQQGDVIGTPAKNLSFYQRNAV